MYWEQGFENAPDIVLRCRDSWINQNPDWEVVLYDKTTAGIDLVPEVKEEIFSELPFQKKANLIRLKLLRDNGGVWADATCLCAKPLNEWLFESMGSGLFMFSRPGRDREISNWFIASEPENYAITRLYETQCRFWNTHRFDHYSWAMKKVRPWLARFINRNRFLPMLWFFPPVSKGLKVYPYFIFHYAFFRLILTDQKVRAIWRSVRKIPAEYSVLPQKLGLLEESTPETLQVLARYHAPVYKLNHHVRSLNEVEGTHLGYVLARHCGKPMGQIVEP